MNDHELLIKIRTALESGGLDEAKRKLTDLTSTIKETSATTAANSVETDKTTQKMHGLGQVVSGVTTAVGAQGLSWGSLRNIMNGVHNLVGSFSSSLSTLATRLTAIGAAAAAGWTAGSLIYKKFVDDVKGVGPAAEKSVEELKKINDVKLKAINDAVAELTSNLETSVSRIERLAALKQAIEGAEAGTKKSRLEKQLAGVPETDPEKRAQIKQEIAKLEFTTKEAEANQTIETSAKKQDEIVKAMEGIDKQIEKAKAPLKELEERRKYAEEMGITNAPGLRQMRHEIELATSTETESFESKKKELLGKKAGLALQLDETKGQTSVAMSQVDTASAQYDAAGITIQNELKQRREELNKKAAEKAAEEARKKERKAEQDRLAEMEEEAGLIEEVLPGMQLKAHRDAAAEQSAHSATIPKKGILGGGVTAADKKALQEASQERQQSDAALNQILAYYKELVGNINLLSQQMKNAQRANN